MRAVAPRLASTTARPAAPAVRAASGSASQASTAAASASPSSTTRAAPASISSAYTSSKLCTAGPVSTGTLQAAASRGLWPPVGTREPPTKATSATA